MWIIAIIIIITMMCLAVTAWTFWILRKERKKVHKSLRQAARKRAAIQESMRKSMLALNQQIVTLRNDTNNTVKNLTNNDKMLSTKIQEVNTSLKTQDTVMKTTFDKLTATDVNNRNEYMTFHKNRHWMDEAVQMKNADPGPMIERINSGVDDRYGIGQFPHGQLRMYSSGTVKNASIRSGFAELDGTFRDITTVNRDGLQVDGNLRMADNNIFCIDKECLSKYDIARLKMQTQAPLTAPPVGSIWACKDFEVSTGIPQIQVVIQITNFNSLVCDGCPTIGMRIITHSYVNSEELSKWPTFPLDPTSTNDLKTIRNVFYTRSCEVNTDTGVITYGDPNKAFPLTFDGFEVGAKMNANISMMPDGVMNTFIRTS